MARGLSRVAMTQRSKLDMMMNLNVCECPSSRRWRTALIKEKPKSGGRLPVIFLIVTVELCSTLNKIRRSSRTGLENLSRTLARDGGT